MPEKTAKGETNGFSKLTENEVKEIRRLHAIGNNSYRQLASRFGISFSTVGNVVTRKRWRHI
jgi:DNA invertase Pin-like site-specific DNA recombinase